MDAYPVGFGWIDWMIPRALIDESLPLLDQTLPGTEPDVRSRELTAGIRNLLDETVQWKKDTLTNLRTQLLEHLDQDLGLEGLVGLQAPLVSGQTTGNEEDVDPPRVHTLAILAVAIGITAMLFHPLDMPKTIARSRQ